MQISLGRNKTGIDIFRSKTKRGFLLMIFGWSFVYVHFLEEYIGIAWSRNLEIGKRRWWFTESWRLWAKKNRSGFKYAL